MRIISVLPVALAVFISESLPACSAQELQGSIKMQETRDAANDVLDAPQLEAYVDGVVTAYMREHKIPGVAVAIVHDGHASFTKGYGDADIEAGRKIDGGETLMRIGSISKTFVWTSVMMLADRGQLDLDADINSYLKDMQIPEKFGAPITMNDLMGHRAGFEDSYAIFTQDFTSGVNLTDALSFSMPARVFPPGARASYSNFGAALAAKIVEDVSGTPFQRFLEDEILVPLNLGATSFVGPAEMRGDFRARLAKGYAWGDGAYDDVDYLEIGALAPTGAMSMSAEDMSRWMRFHLGGGALDGVRLMSSEAHRKMWTRGFTDNLDGAGVAHGFYSSSYRGHKTFGHGGATSAFYSNMVLTPDLGLGVYHSQNSPGNTMLMEALNPLVINHLLQLPAASGVVATANTGEADRPASEFSGAYRLNRRPFTTFQTFLYAGAAYTKIADGGEGALIVGRKNKSRFTPISDAEDAFENIEGARISFGRNADGDITHYTDKSGFHSWEKTKSVTTPGAYLFTLAAAAFFSVTIWLGAWRRQGRAVSQSPTGHKLNLLDLGAAVLVFVLGVALLMAAMSIQNADAKALPNYPYLAIVFARLIAYGVFAAGIIGVVSLLPAWTISGWGFWRKLHHMLFILALAALAFMLVYWRAIFSAA